VARSYLGDYVLTGCASSPDPFFARRPQGCTSRDRGVLRASGELEFLVRAYYPMKVTEVRIELGEIYPSAHVAGVVEAVVVARTPTPPLRSSSPPT